MYLVVIKVPGEREDRVKVLDSQSECASYIQKIRTHMLARDGVAVKAAVYRLGEPVEEF